MTTKEIMAELKNLGSEQTRKIWSSHGATGEFFGVKIGDMKVIQKKIGHNQGLSLELFETGNADARYLAGLISEPAKMTKAQLQGWAQSAQWHMLSEYTVAWVAAESKFGHELALDWINSSQEHVAAAGWSTYNGLLALKKNEDLDLTEMESLLVKIQQEIHKMPNRVRNAMNNFLISVGTYVPSLTSRAKEVAKSVGDVKVDVGNTSCKVPDAIARIEKAESAGKIGKKKKTVFC
jgi:3-methyladenine DNA glycosylase AlkD